MAVSRTRQQTLATPRRKYGVLATILFKTFDVLSGKKRTLSKFKVLELVARVPYQSLEQVGYIAITHVHDRNGPARGSSIVSARRAISRTTSNGTC